MKRPTQTDVARAAGVSRATVSYVLNGSINGKVPISTETLERVRKAIADLGYEPDASAQALRSGSTKTIGAIIPDLRNPHFCEYAIGIEQAAREAGYHILLSSTALNEDHALKIFKDLARRRIDGLILASSFSSTPVEIQKTLTQLHERQLPVVEISNHYNVDSAFTDYGEVTREVMAYLFSLGHQRIGMIYGVAAPEIADDRRLPYIEILQEANCFNPDLIVECGPTTYDGYQAARQLLQRQPRPTAVVAINDVLAIGVLRAANDLGLRVPADVSLVGFDDIQMAQFLVPSLTTVSKDAIQAGREAFQLLLARIKEPERPRQQLKFSARLIIRESTGPAPTETQ